MKLPEWFVNMRWAWERNQEPEAHLEFLHSWCSTVNTWLDRTRVSENRTAQQMIAPLFEMFTEQYDWSRVRPIQSGRLGAIYMTYKRLAGFNTGAEKVLA